MNPHLPPSLPAFDTAAALLTAGTLALALLSACGGDSRPATTAKEVPEWNRIASDAITSAGSPAQQVHGMAIVQIAVHDALNAIERRRAGYATTGTGSAPAAAGASRDSAAAAVATATRDVLVRLIPAGAPSIEQQYAAKLTSIDDGAAKTAGIDAGRAAANAILDRRAGDDLVAATLKQYTVRPGSPGVYQKTPPSNVVIGAGFGELAPFGIADPKALRSLAPPPSASPTFAVEFDEVKRLGAVDSAERDTRQTETARFWYDAATREWHDAARQGLAVRGADEWEAAHALAVMSIAMFDALVASFETKFHFEYWRPITAIRDADRDDNPATEGDVDWLPLCDMPPFPEYNSTHAATGAAAAGVLSRLLGDALEFTVASPTLAGVSRRYVRFSDAAREEAVSRIYCGIHFRSAMDAGLSQGDRVADAVVRSLLPPAE